ncbi:hypothetical protein PR048_029692 [Dryococelus australis]|uniref:Uncharacterized protein n=1 Tax=Dryococelus australis TaxID=614101 RepID=A0ABQ9GE43_9NEOP|nr:hypothetical protein PR048_029692 [Dryococelus australis]
MKKFEVRDYVVPGSHVTTQNRRRRQNQWLFTCTPRRTDGAGRTNGCSHVHHAEQTAQAEPMAVHMYTTQNRRRRQNQWLFTCTPRRTDGAGRTNGCSHVHHAEQTAQAEPMAVHMYTTQNRRRRQNQWLFTSDFWEISTESALCASRKHRRELNFSARLTRGNRGRLLIGRYSLPLCLFCVIGVHSNQPVYRPTLRRRGDVTTPPYLPPSRIAVRYESSQAAKSGGCFPGDSRVTLPGGHTAPLSDLRPGQQVLAADPTTGRLLFSEVLTFLDRDPASSRLFVQLATTSGCNLTVTPAHLLASPAGFVFAGDVRAGDVLLAAGDDGRAGQDTVVSARAVLRRGVFAPLTRHGTVVVDGLLASCYAVVSSQALAHWTLAPLRLAINFRDALWRVLRVVGHPATCWQGDEPLVVSRTPTASFVVGVHWYARLLHGLSQLVLPANMFYH